MDPALTPPVAPYLVVNDADGLVRFLERTLGARRGFELRDPGGRLHHAELRIGDGLVMLADPPEGRAPFPGMVHVYVPDARTAFDRLLAEGATPVRPPQDAGDGTIRGGAKDRWGNEWWVSSRVPAK